MHNRLTKTGPFYCIPSFNSLCTQELKVCPHRVVKTFLFKTRDSSITTMAVLLPWPNVFKKYFKGNCNLQSFKLSSIRRATPLCRKTFSAFNGIHPVVVFTSNSDQKNYNVYYGLLHTRHSVLLLYKTFY